MAVYVFHFYLQENYIPSALLRPLYDTEDVNFKQMCLVTLNLAMLFYMPPPTPEYFQTYLPVLQILTQPVMHSPADVFKAIH